MDGSVGEHELRAHAHEEAVEHVHALLALDGVHHAAVEAAAELHQLIGLLRLAPRTVQRVGVDAEVRAGVKSIVHLAGRKGRLPRQAELGFELVRRDGQLCGLQQCRLGSNRVIVLVDQHAGVDLLASQLALGHNLDAARSEVRLHHVLGGGGVGVGFDEHERRVVLGGQSHRCGQALLAVHVLQLVEQRLALHLRVHAPLLDGARRHAGSQQLRTERVLRQVALQPVHALC
mmetsp:Transcript_12523/g.23193  ORF Transcript_12523/g.23193 Transcript_12523/m.23193 type:complete len:232 (+) Transcript_12523:429-1124(+)